MTHAESTTLPLEYDQFKAGNEKVAASLSTNFTIRLLFTNTYLGQRPKYIFCKNCFLPFTNHNACSVYYMKRKFTEASLKGGPNLPIDFDFDVFLTSGASNLTKYCAAIIGPADAEDAAQEAFVRLWKNLHRINDEKAAYAFLYRTAYRVCIDMIRLRKRFRQPKVPNKVNNTISEEMECALLELSPIDRAILYSRVVDECGYDEIAARFHKNEPWARKRCSLAKKKLKTILERMNSYERP